MSQPSVANMPVLLGSVTLTDSDMTVQMLMACTCVDERLSKDLLFSQAICAAIHDSGGQRARRVPPNGCRERDQPADSRACAQNPASSESGWLAGAFHHTWHIPAPNGKDYISRHLSRAGRALQVMCIPCASADWQNKGVPASGTARAAGGRSRPAPHSVRAHHPGCL